MRVFYSFLITVYHTCQVTVTEIHETFSSDIFPLQRRGLEDRKKKAWKAEGIEVFKMELSSEKLGGEKNFLGRECNSKKKKKKKKGNNNRKKTVLEV